MQSRTYEEIESYRRSRDNRGVELSRESHFMPPHHDIYDGSLMRPLSPGIGSSRGDRRSGSMERRDYSWGRNEIGRLRSPRFGLIHERINCDDSSSSRDEMRRKYEFCDYMDRLDDMDTSLMCNYSDKSRFSGNTGKDIASDRALGADLKRDYSGNKSMIREDGTGQGRYRLSGDVRPSNYHEHSGDLGSSLNVDLGRFKYGGVKYPDSVFLDKISAIERYGNPELSLRDAPHFKDLTFPSRGISGRSQFKEFGSMSAGGSFLDSHDEGMSISTEMYRASSTKALEPFSGNEYGRRRSSETRGVPELGHKDLIGYQRDTFCPDKEDEDDLHARPKLREDKYCDYASEELNRGKLLYERDSYDPRDMLTRKESIPKHIDDHEQCLTNVDRSLQGLPSYQKHFSSESLDCSRLPYTLKHGGRYLDCGSPGLSFERDALREPEMSSLGISHDNDILRTKYDFESVAGSLPIEERMRNSSDRHYNTERHDFKIKVSSELNRNNLDRMHDLTDRDERCNEYADDLLFSKTLEYENGRFSRAGKRTFGAETGRISAPEDWSTPYDSAEHVEERSIKSGRKKPKVQVKPGLLNWNSMQRSEKKHYLLKNVWVRGRDDVKVDMQATDVEGTENLSLSAKSEPPENSEEFKQIVHWFFLSFTKKINVTPSARKRYKEQGKAGSLFCIVCSRRFVCFS